MQLNRNMVVIRRDTALTLIGPVRLSGEGEAALKELGSVQNIVRLGVFHGMDDAYYKHSFRACFWCQEKSSRYPDPEPDRYLEEGGELPLADAELFVFHLTRMPECALVLKQYGGILITCDGVQHYGNWKGINLPARLVMRLAGFRQDTLVGPFWKKMMTPQGGSLEPDFRRLLDVNFRHLVSAHGTLRRDDAHEAVAAAVARSYGT